MAGTITIGSHVRPIGCDWRGKVVAILADLALPIAIVRQDGGGVYAESVDRLELAPAPTVTGEPR